MQLYVQAWLLDKDGNRVKQNMAITIHHPEAMTDEKAEQLLESLKDELLQKWGDDYTLESIDFVPEQNLDMKIVEGGEIHSWHNLYYRVVALSVKDMQIDFRTDALFSVNLGKNPLLVNRQIQGLQGVQYSVVCFQNLRNPDALRAASHRTQTLCENGILGRMDVHFNLETRQNGLVHIPARMGSTMLSLL